MVVSDGGGRGREGALVGVDGDGGEVELSTCRNDPAGYLAAVGDEDALEFWASIGAGGGLCCEESGALAGGLRGVGHFRHGRRGVEKRSIVEHEVICYC